MLPDNVLLEIFHFCKDEDSIYFNLTWSWKTLTQVCRRWRHVVFESPRRLDLQLVCTSTTPTSRLLDIWPPFPIIVYQPAPFPVVVVDKNGMENLITALEFRDRISEIHIYDIRGPALEHLVAALHEPLPVLTRFSLNSGDDSAPVLPETFLGGSAPRLQSFGLKGIPFPSFPKFILCFHPIVHLRLGEIPNSGYILPEVMVTCLAALPNLGFLSIGFRSPPSHLLQIGRPRLTRRALPSLSHLEFSGVSEYFEDFVARIHTPRLIWLRITFFMDLVFDIPQLRHFIGRTEGLGSFYRATIWFSGRMIEVSLGSPIQLALKIKCERSDWQLSSMTQILSQQFPLLSLVEQVEIIELPSSWGGSDWNDDPDMDSLQWLELFHLFVAAQSLYVSEKLVPPVASALQDLTGHMATEVFPVLQTLSLEGLEPSGPLHEAIKSFATARQLSHQPVVVQRWERQGLLRP